MNDLINKIGIDKILHFVIGALVAFCFDIPAILQEGLVGDWLNVAFTSIGVIVVAMAAFFKEAVIDSKFDWKDFVVSIAGALLPTIVVIIGTLFYIGSN
jgi:hypothetical protein|nr:MAG TPA: putative periplasmic lipoprotein [Crassvirales sp.]